MKRLASIGVLAAFALLLLHSCSRSEELLSEPFFPEETLGINALSWVAPYVGNSRVIFENQRGDRMTFSIESTERTFLKSTFAESKGETFTLRLRSMDGNRVIELIPLGNLHLALGTTENTRIFDNALFYLIYAPYTSRTLYWVQWNYTGNALTESTYTYGERYPKGGDDAFRTNITNDAFLQAIVLQQGAGIRQFTDRQGDIWEQVEIQ